MGQMMMAMRMETCKARIIDRLQGRRRVTVIAVKKIYYVVNG